MIMETIFSSLSRPSVLLSPVFNITHKYKTNGEWSLLRANDMYGCLIWIPDPHFIFEIWIAEYRIRSLVMWTECQGLMIGPTIGSWHYYEFPMYLIKCRKCSFWLRCGIRMFEVIANNQAGHGNFLDSAVMSTMYNRNLTSFREVIEVLFLAIYTWPLVLQTLNWQWVGYSS